MTEQQLPTLLIPNSTVEQLEATFTAKTAIRGKALDWAFPATTYDPTVWTAGTWDPLRRLVGLTPSIGGTGATVQLAAGTYDVYARIGGSGGPVLICGSMTLY